MSVGIEKRITLAIGQEAASGTAVAATAIMRVFGQKFKDGRKAENVKELNGYFNSTDTNFIPGSHGTWSIGASKLNILQFPYWLWLLLQGPVSSATTGTIYGSGVLYSANIPTTSGITIAKTATMEFGDNFEAENMAMCIMTKLSVIFGANTAVTFQGDGHGRNPDRMPGGKTAIATLAASDVPLTTKSVISVDPIGGVYGAGALMAGQIYSGQIDYEFKYTPNWEIGGPVDAYGIPALKNWDYIDHVIKGKLKMRHDVNVSGNSTGAGAGTSPGQIFQQRSNVSQILRAQVLGKALATPGTGATHYNNNAINFDMPVHTMTVGDIVNDNGVNTRELNFESWANLTQGDAGKIQCVVDGLTTLP